MEVALAQLEAVLWFVIAFVAGSLPFSYWIGRLGGEDIRRFGDENPGATNVMRALGWRWFLPAALLDYFKGAVPVGAAFFIGRLEGLSLFLVALGPLLGHVFSPWLGFRGGKGVAVTLGIWTGLTLAAGPTILGLFIVFWSFVIKPSAWVVLTAMLSFGVFVLQQSGYTFSTLLAIWAGHLSLLLWAHRAELAQRPRLRMRLWKG